MKKQTTVTIKGLTAQQRMQARKAARELVVMEYGDKPTREQFNNNTIPRIPIWMQKIIAVMNGFAILFAFVMSAQALHEVGRQIMSKSLDNPASIELGGIMIVALSEISVVVLSLSLVMVEDKLEKVMIWAGIATCAAIAIGGNYIFAAPDSTYELLIAVGPPGLVISLTWIWKRQWLHIIESRYQNELAFQSALTQWDEKRDSPEYNPRYTGYLVSELKETIIRVNSRGRGASDKKAIMNSWTDGTWRERIQNELNADGNWFENAPQKAHTDVSSDLQVKVVSTNVGGDKSDEITPFLNALSPGKSSYSPNGNGKKPHSK
jgi:hypothetical protein